MRGRVQMSKTGINSNDLLTFNFLSDPQLSPDGKSVIFVRRHITDEKKYRSKLYIQTLTDKQMHPFTQGESNDTNPRWSPNGKTIAFVSDRSGKNQIWTIPAKGGEAKQITFLKNGASNPLWSPDSQQVLVTTSLGEDETLDSEDEKEEKQLVDKVYETEKVNYKADGAGLLPKKHAHLALIEKDGTIVKQVTAGPYDHSAGNFSPDGKQVLCYANQFDDPEDAFLSDVYIIDLDAEEQTKITNSDGRYSSPLFSPDGSKISFLGHDQSYKNATLIEAYVYDLATGETICVTENWDVVAADTAINDMGTGVQPAGAVWNSASSSLYLLGSTHGKTQLYTASLDKEITCLCGGDRQIYAFNPSENADAIILAISDPTTPGDLFSFDKNTKEEQRLTAANEDWLAEKTISIPETFHFQAHDQSTIQGWIIKPVGFKDGEKYPLVVEIHGGPHAMYSYAFMHEFQVLAEKGYGVLYINPRGSFGYGQNFVNAVRGAYGQGDYQDILDAVDYALETYVWIDHERIGVTGGSYGGFMTNWIVTHTNRFKAAVTQRSISNWISFYGVSDIGYFFNDWQLKASLLDNPDKLWEFSPLRYVKQVETPILILHSENDLRCPIEQGEQFYVAIKQQKKTAKLVRFPASDHNLSRNGDPSLRIKRLNEMTGWFAEYL